MKLKVVGCYGTEENGYLSTSFLIDDIIALDAGSLSSLDLKHQRKIKQIFLTHSHLDHIKSLAPLTINAFSSFNGTVNIYGIEDTLHSLKKHILNNQIWPDFCRIMINGSPIFALKKIKFDETVDIFPYKVTVFKTVHSVPSAGYLIEKGDSSLFYSGDGIIKKDLLVKLSKVKNLKALIVDVTFNNSLNELAKVSFHNTPKMLKNVVDKYYKGDGKFYIYHMIPAYLKDLKKELKEIDYLFLHQGLVVKI